MKKNLLFLLMLAVAGQSFAEYNIVHRTQLIEDRLKLQESLRPLGHDFYFDANGFFSADIFDLMDDVSLTVENIDAIDSNDPERDQKIIDEFSLLSNIWDGKELSGRLNFGLGIPLFQFNAWGIKFVPEIVRIDVGFISNISISKESISPTQILNLLPDSATIPTEVKDVVAELENTDFEVGDSLFDVLVRKDGTLEAFLNLPENAGIKDTLESFSVNSSIKSALSGTEIPNLNIYLKADAKVGPKLAWYGQNFFGHVNLYGLMRVDTNNLITSALIDGNNTSFDAPTDVEETNLTLDAAVGYRADNFSIIASMDEVKLTSLSEADDANNLYGTPILFKVYAEMNFKPFDFMKLKTFGGVHKREGYGFGDGYFLGVDLGAYVWGDRLGIQFRTQLDPEHVTFAPQFKFWVMQLEGMYKLPIASDVDGRKPGSMLGVNFRIFI